MEARDVTGFRETLGAGHSRARFVWRDQPDGAILTNGDVAHPKLAPTRR